MREEEMFEIVILVHNEAVEVTMFAQVVQRRLRRGSRPQ